MVGKVLLCQRSLQQNRHVSIVQAVLQIEAFVGNVAAACAKSTILSKQNGQQGASSPVPLSCTSAHQQAPPHWPCTLTQVEPAMHSCMSASKVCSESKGTEKCPTLTKTACLSFCTAAKAACILLMSEAFSANAACSKLGMSALRKLYCR